MNTYNAVLARNPQNIRNASRKSSQTVAFSHYNNLSAQLPVDPMTGELVSGGISAQAKQCFINIEAILTGIDHVMNDIVKITIFVKNIADLDAVIDVYRSFFSAEVTTLTTAAVADLPLGALVQVEALVSNGEGTIQDAPQAGDLVKVSHTTKHAPDNLISAHTVAFSHYNNLSAQLPLAPQTGQLVSDDIKQQTRQCLKNIKAILESIDVPVDDIVKINIFLTDLADLDVVNSVYTTFFPDSAIARAVAYFPARTVIPVSALPMKAKIQIEAVVSHGDGTPPQEVEDRHGIVIKAHNTPAAPQCALSTQTVVFSHYNHLSAQLPIIPETGKIMAGTVEMQTRQCLKNIKTIIESINHSMDDVVKVNIFLKNIADMESADIAYAEYFPNGIPARKVVGVTELPAGAFVQIDVILSNAEGTPPARG